MQQKNIPVLRFAPFADEWEMKKLGTVSDFLDGRRRPIKESERAKRKGIYPYYGASGIIDWVNDFIFDEELILLGEDGENILSRNLPLAFRVSGKCWVNNHAHVLQPKTDTNIDFLAQNLERISFVPYNTGTVQPKLNQEVCKNIVLPFPSLPEQQKIGHFFAAIDTRLSQLRKQQNLLDAYKKGAMQQIFTRKWRFQPADGSDFPDWEAQKLGTVGHFRGGGTPSTKEKTFWQGTIPWISSSDLTEESIHQIHKTRFITEEALAKSATKLVPAKSILIVSRVGVGKIAVTETALCTSQDFTNLTLHHGNHVFFAYLLKRETHKLLEFNQGTSIKGFVKSDLEALEISIPCLEEQTLIADFLSAIDAKLIAVRTQITQTEAWKKGLLQRMLI